MVLTATIDQPLYDSKKRKDKCQNAAALLVLKKFTHVSCWHCPHRIFKAEEEEGMVLVALRGEIDVRSA